MGHCLSGDLRNRVVREVEKGSSCRSAAARFGVSAASAIRWVQAFRKTGTPKAKPQGGDRRSKRIEAQHAFISGAEANCTAWPAGCHSTCCFASVGIFAISVLLQ